MAHLKTELDNYLARNEKPQIAINMPKLGSVGKWLSTPLLTEAAEDNSICPSMSRMQRFVGFSVCMALGILCFIIAALYTPVLLLKARKFALMYTMGSLFTVCSFSFLHGPSQHMKNLVSWERLPFTLTYFGTMIATLYFALIVQSTPFTVLCAVGQIIALMWFVASYIPGGQVGLKFFTHLCSSAVTTTVSKTLPV